MSSVAFAQLPQPKSLTPDASDPVFVERLKTIGGEHATDCGTTSSAEPEDSVAACGLKAFRDHKQFFLGYYAHYGVMGFAYGLAGDASGNVFVITYQVRAFPTVAPTRRTQIMDDNHTRVTECIKPVTLDKTKQGLLACITPVNQQESDEIAHQKPVDTTVCAVLENPASFNNKLVRIRGHFSGNFEYSMLSGDGCKDALWFGYGGGGGPPSLAIYIGGGARPGSEDSEGRLVLPVPVNLIRDSRLERFEKQTAAMAKADADYEKEHPNEFVSHCVTATFIGRIDAVSSEVHEFRRKQKTQDHSDGLGFGQMGLFEAQLIVQSVVDDAALGVCEQ
ncbi:MAG: hypothetical protein WA320_19810 [Candidatus Sulfotelmatobacter sp.]